MSESILTGAEAAAVLHQWPRPSPPAPPAPWLLAQCPTLNVAQATQFGKDGWEPFSVHTGPDGIPRIWWRKREWGP